MQPYMAYENTILLLAPQDITATDTASSYMRLKNTQAAGFLVTIGAITTATATDTVVLTVDCATAEGGTEAAVAFTYRAAGALGANTWGAVTTADTTGVTVASTDDNKMWWIELDLPTLGQSDYVVARVVATTPADMTNCLIAVHGVSVPRYKQTTFISVTASASA